ncbi:MAG: adenylate kinase, partial [Verrucomicrobiota bacterium]
VTFSRSLRRAFHSSWTKQELWPGTGNRETFRKSFFSRDSVVLWCLENYGKIRNRNKRLMADPQYAHILFIRLKSPKDAEKYLASRKNPLKPLP